MKVISLAHECVPEFDSKLKKITYRGASPDEVTLVDFAAEVGFKNIEQTETISSL
jgi:magnesium-transporting ATPase (P-type)